MLAADYYELVRHMEWADWLVWKSVLAVPEAQSDTNMRERLYHMHVVQWAYLQIWRDQHLEMRDPASFHDLRAIRVWARDYYREVAGHLDALDAASLRRQVQLPWTQQLVERWGSARPATLAQTIIQVVSHSTYHRGQVNTRLRELGGEPPLTDFIAWIWMGRPTPAWEELAA